GIDSPEVQVYRLFAKHRLARASRALDDRCVRARRGAYHDRTDGGIGQRFCEIRSRLRGVFRREPSCNRKIEISDPGEVRSRMRGDGRGMPPCDEPASDETDTDH